MHHCIVFTVVPGAPGKPVISAIEPRALTLTWAIPEDDGGSPILGYIVESKDKFSSRWTKDNIGLVRQPKYQVMNLKEATDYEFRILAENKAGIGEASEPAIFKVTPPSAPGKPIISDIAADKATVTWTPPESDGGSKLLGYIVEKCDTKSEHWVKVNRTPVKELTMRLEDLIIGHNYQIRVYAENKVGSGPPNEPSAAFLAKLPYGKMLDNVL